MPPRYPVGSMLGGLFMATIFPIMSKVPFKKLNPAAPVIGNGTDFNTIGSFTEHNTTNIPLVTPATTGLLSFLLSFLVSIFSVFGEELINTAFIYVFHIYVVPSLMAFYAQTVSKLLKKARPDPKDGQKLRPVNYELQHLRAVVKHGAAQVSDLKETLTKSESEKRDAVSRRAQAEEAKTEAIAKLAREKRGLESTKDRLLAAMRDAVDPRGLYPNEEVLRLAKDLEADFRRVASKLERKSQELKQAQETGQLAQKDQQISELTNANSALGRRVNNLERSLRDAAEVAEWAETTSQEAQRKLRERALNAERVATSGTMPIEAYRRKLSEVHDLEVAVTTAQRERQQAVDAVSLLTSELEDEKAKAINLQKIVDNELEARQQSEDSEEVPATATNDLQLAKDRIATLESEAQARDEKVRDADEKARIATEKVAENATTVTELEQKLRESRDQANEWRQANEGLVGELEKREKALKKKTDEAKPEVAGTVPNEVLIKQINDLRAQLDQATQQKPESSELEKQRLRDEGYERAEKDCERQAELLVEQAVQQANREAGERLTAAVSKKEQEVQASIQEKWQQENRDAGERLTAAVSQKEQEVQALFEQKWTSREAEWSANFDAECNKRVNTITMALGSQNSLDKQLQAAMQRAITAERRLENPKGELKEARAVANTAYNGAKEQYNRAEAAEARAKEAGDKAGVESDRADAAEEEVAKYKKGKESQDGRMKNLHDEIATLKRSRPEAAEYQATKNDLARAQALICEYCNRCYDFATRNVVVRLCKANDKIEILKELLEKPTTRPSRGQLLGIVLDAEVRKEVFLKLYTPENRQVVIRQSAAVDAKLMILKHIINKSKEPNKAELLAEILKPRGDENASFDMEPGPLDPPESDEDEDSNGSVSAADPVPRVTALPTSRRRRQPKETEGQNAPLPIDPNSDNPLKRKGGDGEMGPDGSGKRHDTSTMGMRPIGDPFAQGSSSPDANDGQSEAKLKSQDDFQTDSPFPDRIGEATAPEQQSNDQTDLSPQLPGSPSFLVQLSTPFNAAISSQDLSHVEHALHPKPTKIPGPTVSSQEAAAPSSSEAPTGFSFSVPKDIASAVVKQTPTQQYHSPIFTGLSRLGAAMADNNSALPGLPSVEDEVLEFESSVVTEGQDSDSEPDDEFPVHIASDVEEDDETGWENALYPEERGYHFVINLHPQSFPDDGDDYEPSTVRALDMTDQNYEEQAAEAVAALRNIQQDPSKKKSQPKGEVLEDNFHIDLD